MHPGSHHIIHYLATVSNDIPVVVVVVLGFIGGIIFIGGMANESWIASILGLMILGSIAIPVTQMQWTHKEPATRAEMVVDTGTRQVWVPAHKLISGEWWPNNSHVTKKG